LKKFLKLSRSIFVKRKFRRYLQADFAVYQHIYQAVKKSWQLEKK
jgi:hypothetical protein